MDRRRRDWIVLGVCALLVVYFQAVRWDWFIDDAAICFAYARNLANGEGFVAVPGGERVEGVSDPTWMALLTLFQLVGLDGFHVAKPLALVLTLALLPVILDAARQALPAPDSPAAPVAPFVIGGSAQIGIWAASGLENPLWCLLLGAAIATTVSGAKRGRFLWPGVLWFLVTWTRPEGIAYAALGGFWYLVASRRAGQRTLRDGAGLAAVILVPTALLYAARLWYFAWPFANTYYAKVAVRPSGGLSWTGRGLEQVRDWSARLWAGYALPPMVVGITGRSGPLARRGLAVAAVCGALLLIWPAPDALAQLWFWPRLPAPPVAWLHLRTGLLVAGAVLLPLFGVGRRGFEVVGLSWHLALFTVVFSAMVGGDWMGAYRFMNPLMPPFAILAAVGVHELGAWLTSVLPDPPEKARSPWSDLAWLGVALVVLAWLPPNLSQVRDHALYNINETPAMVSYRVRYSKETAARAFWEEPIVNLDMDQGAHLWLAPEFTEIDMAGLIDVPMAHHRYNQRAFVQEYVFEQHPPTFAHVHLWWARFSDFESYDAWSEMFPLPAYQDIPPLPPHLGTWARRSLVEAPSWTGTPGRRVAFGGGVVVEGAEVPTVGAPGEDLYVEIGLRTLWERERAFGVILFLADPEGVRASWAIPRGMGLMPVGQWRTDRVVIERNALRLPDDLPEGTYDLGVVLLGPDDQAWFPGGPASEPVGPEVHLGVEDARLARSEMRIEGLVHVVSPAERDAAADASEASTLRQASDGTCEEAERSWVLTKRHHPRDEADEAARRPRVSAALAACWAGRAERDPERAPEHLARAHRWDHRSPELARVGAPVGERLWASGKAAFDRGAWADAQADFEALLAFQPWRSWARRYAEECRDRRLGLVGDHRIDRTDFTDREQDRP
ncbi:MAG: hypothetical protein H6735_25470 [Alphaproteobacteria bacterium]|nr:hypothetical protein [Alphaproteobacteria bacterium]